MFCWSLFVLLYFFFWSLCCLFFDIRILIALLVSSNSACLRCETGQYNIQKSSFVKLEQIELILSDIYNALYIQNLNIIYPLSLWTISIYLVCVVILYSWISSKALISFSQFTLSTLLTWSYIFTQYFIIKIYANSYYKFD
jgi:hypothetical protein